ncbi:TPA: hypothetical protein ACP2L8_004809 [Escherichia coli]
MQPSPAMQALIEQIYHIFRRYPVPQKFVVCWALLNKSDFG